MKLAFVALRAGQFKTLESCRSEPIRQACQYGGWRIVQSGLKMNPFAHVREAGIVGEEVVDADLELKSLDSGDIAGGEDDVGHVGRIGPVAQIGSLGADDLRVDGEKVFVV